MTAFVEANGLRFAYLEQGSGPLVLLLHGFPDTAHTWEHAMPAIAAAGYRAVAPFLRGYHPTEVPEDKTYDIDTLGADTIALVDALGGGAPAIVIGHDWGASAAYAAAAIAPEKVRLLITVAVPHPRSIKPTPRAVWALRHFVPLGRKSAGAMIARDDFAYVDTLVQRWSPAWQVPADETARVKAAFREPGCAEAACGYYRAISALRPPRSYKLPITMPTVSFAGEHDSTFRPRAYEKARRHYGGAYEVVQMPGGHFMHREHPEHFQRELLRVLAAHANDQRAAG